jgi:hypothetical protein
MKIILNFNDFSFIGLKIVKPQLCTSACQKVFDGINTLAKNQSHSLGLITFDPKTKQTARLISRSCLKTRRDPTFTYSLRMQKITLFMCALDASHF